MEKVIIDKNWSIEKDFNNFVLVFEEEGEINKNTGKPVHRIEKWYCSTLESSLKRYLNENALDGVDSIDKVLDRLEDIEGKISKLKFK